LVDETYREMNFAGPTPLAASLSPRCISVASLSKSYGLPGIRVGWIMTRDPTLQKLFLAAKEQIFICNSIVDEYIAERAVAQKATLLPPILQRNTQALATLKDWLRSEPLMEWVEPAGGVVCLPRIKASVDIDVQSFYRILNEKYKTFVGPGYWFEQDRRSMRIGYGWPQPSELSEGLENISRALREAAGAT
jgi:aspartate/methionine/tyrosine aminotransferase